MSLHPAELRLVDHVEKTRLELADAGRGGGYGHGVLTSPKDHVLLFVCLVWFGYVPFRLVWFGLVWIRFVSVRTGDGDTRKKEACA